MADKVTDDRFLFFELFEQVVQFVAPITCSENVQIREFDEFFVSAVPICPCVNMATCTAIQLASYLLTMLDSR